VRWPPRRLGPLSRGRGRPAARPRNAPQKIRDQGADLSGPASADNPAGTRGGRGSGLAHSAACRKAVLAFARLQRVTPNQYDTIRERLWQADPDVVLAAEETDGDLLDWFAALPLRQRLERAARMAASLAQLRDARTTR